jgi:hypothetical protein
MRINMKNSALTDTAASRVLLSGLSQQMSPALDDVLWPLPRDEADLPIVMHLAL